MANEVLNALRIQGWNERKQRHRRYQHGNDRIACRQRRGIKGFFAKLKQWRRIATRYDKLAANFLGYVKLASIMLWLK